MIPEMQNPRSRFLAAMIMHFLIPKRSWNRHSRPKDQLHNLSLSVLQTVFPGVYRRAPRHGGVPYARATRTRPRAHVRVARRASAPLAPAWGPEGTCKPR